MTKSLTNGQRAVLQAFSEFGAMDDVALTVYVHHISNVGMSSSGIRTRRAELVRKGMLASLGRKTLKSGKTAAIHGLTPLGKTVARQVIRESRRAAKASA